MRRQPTYESDIKRVANKPKNPLRLSGAPVTDKSRANAVGVLTRMYDRVREYFLARASTTPHRRGYSHWFIAMVNAQHQNGFHFSVRNNCRIAETSPTNEFKADFAQSEPFSIFA